MGYTYDAENFKEIFEKNFTWLNGFMRNVRRFPDKTAMTGLEKMMLFCFNC